MKKMLSVLGLAAAAAIILSSWAVGKESAQKQPKSAAPRAGASAKPATQPAPAPVDICTDAVDPYNPSAQRTLFFKAAGADSELDAKEFTADRSKAIGRAAAKAPRTHGFARRFDRWSALLGFDKNRNKTVDWFEADAYRRDVRSRVLAVYDKNGDGRLTGAERAAAVRALTAGRVPPKKKDPRLAGSGSLRPPPPRSGGPRPGSPSGVRSPGGTGQRHGGREHGDEPLRRFDANGDGRLSTEERTAMIAAMRREADEKKFLKRFDLNRDGTLSEEEREAAVQGIREKHRAEFMGRYDTDGDGQLSQAERAAMRAERGGEFRETLERWRLRDFDKDGNGELDKAEQAQAQAFQKQLQAVGEGFRVKMADLDGDGKVSDEEQKAVVREWRAAGWRMMVKAARYMDTDGDGQVSMEERTAFGRRFGAAMMDWAGRFQMRFDANRDGRLDAEERTALVGGLKEEFGARMAKFDADEDGRVSPEEAMDLLEAFAKEIGITPPRGKGTSARPTIRLPERFRKRPGPAGRSGSSKERRPE